MYPILGKARSLFNLSTFVRIMLVSSVVFMGHPSRTFRPCSNPFVIKIPLQTLLVCKHTTMCIHYLNWSANIGPLAQSGFNIDTSYILNLAYVGFCGLTRVKFRRRE
jgi:hypothetical protein